MKRNAALYASVAAAAMAACVGALVAANQFSTWPNVTSEIAVLQPALESHPGPVLALDDLNTVRYYIPRQNNAMIFGRFYFQYRDTTSGRPLLGNPAFDAAIRQRFFSVVIVSFGSRKIDARIMDDLQRYGGYQLRGSARGHDAYKIWVRDGGAR